MTGEEVESASACEVCADGPEECGCYGDLGSDCPRCGGSGYAIPEHCCDCGGSPYCQCCRKCGVSCAGNCTCPIEVVRLNGSVAVL